MPTDPRWKRADELFDRALDLPRGERSGFLDRECAGDSELRERVLRLLTLADDETPLPGSVDRPDSLAPLVANDSDPFAVLRRQSNAQGSGGALRPP